MLARVNLGTAPGPFEKAGTQCRKFRELLREHLRGVEGLSLLVVKDVDTRELRVEAVYDEGDRLAGAGAEHARGLAPDLWGIVGKTNARALMR